MKQVYNRLNPDMGTRIRLTYTISINTKQGRFTTSAELTRILLRDFDAEKIGVELCQDQERPSDWYIRPVSSEVGFKLHVQQCYGVFLSKTLSRRFLDSLGEGFGRFKVSVAWKKETEGEFAGYYPIITKSIIDKASKRKSEEVMVNS